MTSPLRKFVLTAHITFSVGWFGAVAGFLALAITGLISQEGQMVRSAYLTMELIGWFVILPFCLGSLLTGLIQSLGTDWGLFRHYWVLVKLLLTIAATIIFLIHMQPIGYLADVASERVLSISELRRLRIQLIGDAGAALLVLLVNTTLSVYKPWGRTRYGLSKLDLDKRIPANESISRKSWGLYLVIGLTCLLVLLFVILHLAGGGRGRH